MSGRAYRPAPHAMTRPVSGHRRGLLRAAGALAVAGWLGGCASPRAPGTPGGGMPRLPAFAGRLALQVEGQPERSFAADFELFGSADQGELVLAGPLGTTAARARWSPDEAVLVGPQGERRFADLDSLAREALGEPLPMAALFDWLRGRPWPGAPADPRADGAAGFAQLGWQVALDRLAEGRIEVRRDTAPVVTVRVRLQLPSG